MQMYHVKHIEANMRFNICDFVSLSDEAACVEVFVPSMQAATILGDK